MKRRCLETFRPTVKREWDVREEKIVQEEKEDGQK